MARRRGPVTTQRNIYFYRIENFPAHKAAIAGDFARIANLPFSEGGRYFVDKEQGDRLVVWPDAVDYPIKFRFGRTRLSNLPSVEQRGHLSALSLAEDAGLSECSHIVVFDDGTVAAEFNFDGPRVSQLSAYLFVKRQAVMEKIIFRPLLQHDILQILEKFAGVTLLRVSGPPSAAERLREADRALATAYESLSAAGASRTIDVSLTPKKDDRLRLLETAKKLISRNAADRSGPFALRTLKIRGFNTASSKIDTVDLLQDHLISSCHFLRENERSKAISSIPAYSEIERAYNELLPDLDAAAKALPLW